jgi:hypothetical protein
MKKIAVFLFLLPILLSGCSVLRNSAQFYRDHPPGRIHWREYSD